MMLEPAVSGAVRVTVDGVEERSTGSSTHGAPAPGHVSGTGPDRAGGRRHRAARGCRGGRRQGDRRVDRGVVGPRAQEVERDLHLVGRAGCHGPEVDQALVAGNDDVGVRGDGVGDGDPGRHEGQRDGAGEDAGDPMVHRRFAPAMGPI